MERIPIRLLMASAVLSCAVTGWLNSCQGQTDSHIVTNIRGQVSVKRANRGKFVLAYIGMAVGNGDMFRFDANGAKANVTCSDGNARLVEQTPFTLQCGNVPANRQPVLPTHNHRKIVRLRGGSEPDSYPIVLSPRLTTLLRGTPMIRWIPISVATAYKVSVIQGRKEIWSVSLGNVTEVQYPNDPQFALESGKSFRVIVCTDSHRPMQEKCSSDEKLPNLGFSILDRAEAATVKEAEARIRNLRLPDLSTRLLVADLYANTIIPNTSDGKGLNAEAIELLEGVTDSPSAIVALRLGDLYATIGLGGKAEISYLVALKLSQAGNDLEGQALAQHALGKIYARIKLNQNEANQRLLLAKTLYQSLEDPELAAAVDRDLQELQKMNGH